MPELDDIYSPPPIITLDTLPPPPIPLPTSPPPAMLLDTPPDQISLETLVIAALVFVFIAVPALLVLTTWEEKELEDRSSRQTRQPSPRRSYQSRRREEPERVRHEPRRRQVDSHMLEERRRRPEGGPRRRQADGHLVDERWRRPEEGGLERLQQELLLETYWRQREGQREARLLEGRRRREELREEEQRRQREDLRLAQLSQERRRQREELRERRLELFRNNQLQEYSPEEPPRSRWKSLVQNLILIIDLILWPHEIIFSLCKGISRVVLWTLFPGDPRGFSIRWSTTQTAIAPSSLLPCQTPNDTLSGTLPPSGTQEAKNIPQKYTDLRNMAIETRNLLEALSKKLSVTGGPDKVLADDALDNVLVMVMELEGLSNETGPQTQPEEREGFLLDAACIICFAEISNTVVMPCKHLAMCTSCCHKMGMNGKDWETRHKVQCPICRTNITDKMEIYRS